MCVSFLQASRSRYCGCVPGSSERLCHCHVCQSECHSRFHWVTVITDFLGCGIAQLLDLLLLIPCILTHVVV